MVADTVQIGDIAWSYDYFYNKIIEVKIVYDFGDDFHALVTKNPFNAQLVEIMDDVVRPKDRFFKTIQEAQDFIEIRMVLEG
jgi:hypothetical protein